MAFYDSEHKKEIVRLEKCWDSLHELEDMANEFGIKDIFQDNGAKILQQLVYLKMKFYLGGKVMMQFPIVKLNGK